MKHSRGEVVAVFCADLCAESLVLCIVCLFNDAVGRADCIVPNGNCDE